MIKSFSFSFFLALGRVKLPPFGRHIIGPWLHRSLSARTADYVSLKPYFSTPSSDAVRSTDAIVDLDLFLYHLSILSTRNFRLFSRSFAASLRLADTTLRPSASIIQFERLQRNCALLWASRLARYNLEADLSRDTSERRRLDGEKLDRVFNFTQILLPHHYIIPSHDQPFVPTLEK